MSAKQQVFLSRSILAAGLFVLLVPSQMARSGPVAKNSWRGITPLRSSAEDVARAIGAEPLSGDVMSSGPHKVEGGEVTFSYITPSLARIYRAPRSMIGKVFTIYFKPSYTMTRGEVTLTAGFKRCVEQQDRMFYYYVSDVGVAYRFLREGDLIETIIYQPSRAEVRSLAVNTECVF